jgi:hypothetical protein
VLLTVVLVLVHVPLGLGMRFVVGVVVHAARSVVVVVCLRAGFGVGLQSSKSDRDESSDRGLGRQAAGGCEGVEAVARELARSNIGTDSAVLRALGQQVSHEADELLLRAVDVLISMQERSGFGAVAVVADERRSVRRRILSISIAVPNAAPGSCRAMAFLGHVFEPQPAGPSSGDLTGERHEARGTGLAQVVAAVRRAPELGGLIGLAALLNLWALGRNGWANTYYSAAVRSMAASWHNFLYASADPSGVMTVDKPPLSLWVQALSVRVFGYHPLAILVPQALMGVASVVLVYDLVRRRFGRLGGFAAGLALATTPIAVAMSRDNNPDALLTLCCVAAVWFAVRAFEDGRTRWLVCSGIAVGLGFETKMGVALVVVPAIALAWVWIAPRGRVAAIRQLLAGGGAMLAVGGAWPLLVALTPAADRPWISGTSDNSILSLIFGYNGLGRVSGQSGGPGGGGGGAGVFGQGTGPFRLVNAALGGQDGWLLGFAVVAAVVVLIASGARRRDPRTAWIAVVGGAFLVIAGLFSFAQGIFHPYYVVLLAPFTAALVGAGAASVRGTVCAQRSPARRRSPPARSASSWSCTTTAASSAGCGSSCRSSAAVRQSRCSR